jgi:redox-regulated HSP33 family molecular chaperone
MPRKRRTPLADALERNRELANRIHQIEQGHLPLRAMIERLERDKALLAVKLVDAQRLAFASSRAVNALVSVLHERNLVTFEDLKLFASGKVE